MTGIPECKAEGSLQRCFGLCLLVSIFGIETCRSADVKYG